MTLREALEALHRAGRIASPWLPGMCGVDTAGHGFRVGCMHHNSGGAFIADHRTPYRLDPVGPQFTRMAEVRTSDPATVGCLQALVREASGSIGPHAVFGDGWLVDGPGLPAGYIADTEGEAWAAALIGLAEGTG